MKAVIKPHRAGLFSNINKIITCMRMYEHVHVDWSNGSLYGDCWDELFEFNEPVSEPYDVVTDYPFYDLTAACAGIMYQNEGWGWRERFHPLWKKLGCKIKPVPVRNAIGVLVRCDGHGGEQLSGKSQSLDQYAEAIQKIKSNDMDMYVVSTDQESIDWLGERFSGVWNSSDPNRNARRSDPDRHLSKPQTGEDAKQVMREVLTLANCDYLVHPISNMATAALYINPNLKSIYLK